MRTIEFLFSCAAVIVGILAVIAQAAENILLSLGGDDDGSDRIRRHEKVSGTDACDGSE